jgi:putative transposase
MRHTRHMHPPPAANPYKRHRFRVEIISYCVWLYFCFCLSYRDVEELMAERGVILAYEAVRDWCRKCEQAYANQLRHRRPRPGDKGQLDEVFLTIQGQRHDLWRAVEQEGNILDILVQRRRDQTAAKKLFHKLLKGLTYVLRVSITHKLASYGAAKREVLPSGEHRQHRDFNNRAENSHQPTRQRERRMQRFNLQGQAQCFLAAYGPITSHFRPRRHLLPARAYRQEMTKRFQSASRDFEALPQVRLYAPTPDEYTTAGLFGLPAVIESPMHATFSATISHAWKTCSGENFVIYAGYAGSLRLPHFECLFRALVAFLQRTGFLQVTPLSPEHEEDVHYFGIGQVVSVIADTAGLFISHLEVGRWLQAGDLIGHVFDGFDGHLRAEIKASVAGLLSGIRRQPLLFEGDLMARLQTRDGADKPLR